MNGAWFSLPPEQGVNESAMVTALLETGPLSVLINAEFLQFYKYGVWNLPGCDPESLDHGWIPCVFFVNLWQDHNVISLSLSLSLSHAIHEAVLLVGYGVDKTLFGKKPYWVSEQSLFNHAITLLQHNSNPKSPSICSSSKTGKCWLPWQPPDPTSIC